MKFYADTSFLGNLFFDKQRFTENARRIRDHFQLRPIISLLVHLELRLATLWQRKEQAWSDFRLELAEGKFLMVLSGGEKSSLWQQAESLAEQKARWVQPDALDALHVVFAVNAGCTHFLSYDSNTQQRRFAKACGLKVMPETMPD